MTTVTLHDRPGRTPPGRAMTYGTLAVGTLDALDAIVFFGLRSGARPMRIFQSIAAGVLGPSSFSGGWRSAALGVLLHYVIALLIVSIFMFVSRPIAALRRRPVLTGLAYGVVAYFVMSQVVVPMSAAGGRAGLPPWPVLVNGLLIHMFGVGLPASLAARAAYGRGEAA